jgi:RES domain
MILICSTSSTPFQKNISVVKPSAQPATLHKLRVIAHRTLKLVRTDLATLGITENDYATVNLPRTQEIGAAVEFLGCDGLIAPSARWACDNLILFPDSMGFDAVLEAVSSKDIDWVEWATQKGVLPTQ